MVLRIIVVPGSGTLRQRRRVWPRTCGHHVTRLRSGRSGLFHADSTSRARIQLPRGAGLPAGRQTQGPPQRPMQTAQMWQAPQADGNQQPAPPPSAYPPLGAQEVPQYQASGPYNEPGAPPQGYQAGPGPQQAQYTGPPGLQQQRQVRPTARPGPEPLLRLGSRDTRQPRDLHRRGSSTASIRRVIRDSLLIRTILSMCRRELSA